MPEIEVNGIKLYYELHGSESAPVLVLNNGIIMNAASSWVYQTQTLAHHYRLLQYDCRGQGASDHPQESYSMELHADDLAGLLTALDIDRAHIAGISYGGEVAQYFALNYPHRTLSLILADTVSEVGAELQVIMESWIQAARRADSEAFFAVTVPWNFSPEFILNRAELLRDARQRYRLLDYPAVVRLLECFSGVFTTPRLNQIQAPTCILVGERDRLKGIVYAQLLKQGIPHAELHILHGSGHASCWERPAEFNTVILGFLAKITR